MRTVGLWGAILLILLCAGCFGSRDLDQRAFMVAIAFDEAENGQDGFTITAQFPVPAKMQPEAGGEGKTFETLKITSNTVAEALTQLQREVDRDIFIGHTRILLFGEELARTQGIEVVLDYFKRDFRMQRVAQLAVVQGNAGEMLDIEPPLEQSASAFIFNVLSEQAGSSLDIHTDLGKYLVIEADEGIEPVLPRVFKKGNIVVSGGAAVFRNGRMVGWLTPRETRGYSILVNEFNRGRYIVPSPGRPGERISVRVRKASSNHRVVLQGEQLQILSKIQGGYETIEFTGPQSPNERLVDPLQTTVSRIVNNEARAALERAQELNADIIGYGRWVRGLYPRYWATVNWDEIFPQLRIDLNTNIEWTQTVRRFGR